MTGPPAPTILSILVNDNSIEPLLSERVLNLIAFTISWSSNFQPFSSHGSHELISLILQHTKKNIFFANLTKNSWGVGWAEEGKGGKWGQLQ